MKLYVCNPFQRIRLEPTLWIIPTVRTVLYCKRQCSLHTMNVLKSIYQPLKPLFSILTSLFLIDTI